MNQRYTLVFLLGFISCALLIYVFFFLNLGLSPATGFASLNDVAPANWIVKDNLTLFTDKIVLRINNATISRYSSGGSMVPTLGKNANGIQIVPKSERDIRVGDIVSFRAGGNLIIHRVVRKGIDHKGIYFITRGDNNLFNDGKIRFEDIESVTIGVLW